MMRIRYSFLIICLVLVGLSSAVHAEDKAAFASSQVRIGYVDFDKALNNVSDGKIAKKRLRNEFKEKQKQLDRLQKDLAQMKAEIDRDRLILPSDVLKKNESEYRNKFFELQQMLAAFRREMETRENTLTTNILKRLKRIVANIGKKEGYSLVLEKSQDVVLFAPDSEDITDKVITAYNSGRRR